MSAAKTHPVHLSDGDLAALVGLDRHEQARLLLTGAHGPLVVAPFSGATAAMAYVIWLAYRRARSPGNMLAGRPGYEAAETLLNRALSVAACVGSLREFGHELHERLGLSLSQLPPRDALWWLQACQAHASQWDSLSQEMVLTEAATGARLLDEFMWELKKNADNGGDE